MGCDYYIDKNLYIYYKNNSNITFILLEHDQGYFYDKDDDDDDYKEQLKPRMKPVSIYLNDAFCKPHFEEKYKSLILQHLPIDKVWKDIFKIVKKESRYERD